MTTRKYSSRSQQTTLASGITDTATSCTVISGSALLGGATVPAGTTFTVVIDPDTALEEIVDVTVVSTNVLTIVRGVENNGTGQAHSPGAAVRHMAIGRDFREANLHIEATGGYNDGTGAHTMHGIASGEGDVVGTLKAQTLTQKTLTSPIITNPSISGAGVDASIIFEGAVADAHETTLTVQEPTQDNVITLPNATGTVVLAAVAQTLTNKTMGDALNAGGFKITNLATPTLASDAVRKDFADAQVAAAATSAASAATSAASAATSASSALTSANSASASQTAAATSAASAATSASTMAASVTAAASSATAAATSATSAAASATAAATSATSASASATAASTSATSAAASATAAATSATSAAASATTAANSVATIAGYATTASNSASAAATSASSALTSQTAAATSATSAAASATAAATSATSAAASATAAATSATSAAASATAAAGYVVPSQTGNAGKFLGTDGTAVSWTNSATSFIPTGSTVPTDGIYLPTTNAIGFATNSTERMRVDANGSVGIGVTPTASSTLTVRRALTGGTSANSIFAGGTVQSDVTSQAAVFSSFPATAAAAFTLGNLIHYQTGQSTIGLGSTVTTQIGFNIGAGLTGASFNFGFQGQLAASGNSRWNAYMVGTAPNYFAGRTGIGATLTSGAMAQVVNTTAADVALVVKGAASQSGDLLQVQNSAGTVLNTINSSGQVIVGDTTSSNITRTAESLMISTNTAAGFQLLVRKSTDGTNPTLLGIAKSRGSNASPTAVVSGDEIGRLTYLGFDGTNYLNFAYISSGIDNTVSSGTVPMSLNFATGATSAVERMRIDSSGNVGIGTTTPAAKLDVNGSIKSDNLSGVNAVLNSSFNVTQRGTSFGLTFNQIYTFDRWYGYCVPAGTYSRQATNDTTNLPNIQYCARVQRNNGNATTGVLSLSQSLETVNSIPFAGKTVTFSFYARRGANFSGTSNNIISALYTGTGTDQNFASSGYTGQATPIYAATTLTTTWQRFSYTTTLGATVTELGVIFEHSTTGTAGVSDYFEVTGVQLELGSVATPYRANQPTYAAELAACQRYYYRQNSTAASARLGLGQCRSTTEAIIQTVFPVSMRIAPTALEQTGTASNYLLQDASGSGTNCNAVPAFNDASTWSAFTSMTRASGLVAGNITTSTVSAANIYLGWSAEL